MVSVDETIPDPKSPINPIADSIAIIAVKDSDQLSGNPSEKVSQIPIPELAKDYPDYGIDIRQVLAARAVTEAVEASQNIHLATREVPTTELVSSEIERDTPLKSKIEQPSSLMIETVSKPDTETDQASVGVELPAFVVIASRVQEQLEIPEEEMEQAEIFLQALPEAMQDTLLEFMEAGKSEDVAELQESLIEFAEYANRLHELAMTDCLDGIEAEQLRQLLSAWYEELSITLEQDLDEETVTAFIELICLEDYQPILLKTETSTEYSEEANTEVLINLPPAVQDRLADFMQNEAKEPETVAAIEELLVGLGMEAKPEVIAAFIALVCSEAYQPTEINTEVVPAKVVDIFGERKRLLDPSVIAGVFVAAEQRLLHGLALARLIVRRTVKQPITAVSA